MSILSGPGPKILNPAGSNGRNLNATTPDAKCPQKLTLSAKNFQRREPIFMSQRRRLEYSIIIFDNGGGLHLYV
jgi:hypothetical protein